MPRFTIASFNVKNLIGPDCEYYQFQSYTPEEFAWKSDWLADQLLTLDADVVGFQEIFEEAPLREVIAETTRRAEALNAAAIPDRSRRYHRKAIFRKLEAQGYPDAALAFAPGAPVLSGGHAVVARSQPATPAHTEAAKSRGEDRVATPRVRLIRHVPRPSRRRARAAAVVRPRGTSGRRRCVRW